MSSYSLRHTTERGGMNVKAGYRFLLAALVVGALAAVSGPVLAGGPPPNLTTPAITCLSSTPSSITVQVCGTGANGAPGGFSIHMKTKADWLVDGWAATGSYTCLSLGGNCGGGGGSSQWSLSSGECVSVVISATTVADYAGQNICGVSSDCGIDPLVCGTEYVFRVFAHADGGDFGSSPKGPEPPLSCFTADCPDGGDCSLSWGYWKTHGPVGCNPPGHENLWPVSGLTIGSLALTDAELCAILQENPKACAKGGGPNAGANTVLILEHQLIAAMLNVANGAIDCDFANQAILDANALLAGREYDCVGASTTLGQQLIAVKDLLAAYNSDQCVCPVTITKPSDALDASDKASSARSSSWGKVKTIYR
jgi:hypothetical protein